ncbi:MAG: hypothetical protein LBF85_04400 [Tannerella sp.]|jgi:hypothetical protein|nr:hypothetical protein [Tannerella sp.]
MKKTGQTDPAVLDFFEGIPEQDPVTDGVETSFNPGDFSEMMMEAVYILDFFTFDTPSYLFLIIQI